MLRVERDAGVAIWTIDRPAARNALDYATFAALAAAVASAQGDRSLRAVVLTGAGDVFVSGGDLRELKDLDSPADAARLTDTGHDLAVAIAELPCPVIAALPGAAIGGGAELAVACDLRVADPGATIAFKQVRLGVTTAWGTAGRLAALTSAGAATRLLLTGRAVDAPEAHRIGLVDEVSPPGRARETARALAGDVAAGAPGAVAAMKRLARAATAASAEVRRLEREAFIETWTSADHREAVLAWFERRAPAWGGGGRDQ